MLYKHLSLLQICEYIFVVRVVWLVISRKTTVMELCIILGSGESEQIWTEVLWACLSSGPSFFNLLSRSKSKL